VGANSQPTAEVETNSRSQSKSETAVAQFPEPKQLIDEFFEADRLSRYGYQVQTLTKKVEREDPDRRRHPTNAIDVSYSVIKQHGKVVAQFDGPNFGMGNSTQYALFDFLRNGSEQLIISTTVFRGGRHWVVSLHPEFRVLFDSADFQVGREEFYVVDLDNDGIYEISLEETAFYGMQDQMYIGEIPLPEIIFKYDPTQQKYLPANELFFDYSMRGLGDELRRVSDEKNYLSNRLRILLRYIYAGKETQGWTFFDDTYRLQDKDQMKSRIQSVLNDDPLYQYLHHSK
jgi:hypothetical protein